MSKNEIAIATTTEMSTVSDEVLESYLDSFGNKLKPHHRNQFMQICRAFQLNPFIREVYGIPYGDNFSIIVGYEVYLKRAERSGLLSGWKAYTDGEGTELKGCIEITRKDWTAPFYHEVYFSEYNQNNSMWKSKPRTMIKKVAIAQAFRLVFPEELGGMPYTSDEIPTLEPVKVEYVEPEETITEGQGMDLDALIVEVGADAKAFCTYFKISHVYQLPVSKFSNAVKMLEAKRGK